MHTTLLVLAAGMGSRYGGLKQLDHLGPSGETLMDYSIYDAIAAGFDKIVFVIRPDFEQQFRDAFINKLEEKVKVEVAYQELNKLPLDVIINPERKKPWGTAHAIWVAKDHIQEPFAMINADDFYGREAFTAMAAFLKDKNAGEDNKFAMCGYRLANTLSEHGTVSRGVCHMDNELLSNVEELTQIHTDEEGKIVNRQEGKEKTLSPDTLVSMNFWGFKPSLFTMLEEKLISFLKENAMELTSEVYIPFIIDQLIREDKVTVKVLCSHALWFGVTHRPDKEKAVNNIRRLVKENIYPHNLWK